MISTKHYVTKIASFQKRTIPATSPKTVYLTISQSRDLCKSDVNFVNKGQVDAPAAQSVGDLVRPIRPLWPRPRF
jgi:hypothetical protein